MIPYEELLMAPNREPAERLGAIVGRRFVFNRDQWPAWQRLVDRYSWAKVLRAADMCDPTKRFPNHVEAICQQLSRDESESAQPAVAGVRMSKEEREARARQFAEIRSRYT